MKKFFLFIIAVFSFLPLIAQELAQPAVEMATGLRSSGKIYVVVATIAIIFVGLAIYLIRIDKRLSKLEKETK